MCICLIEPLKMPLDMQSVSDLKDWRFLIRKSFGFEKQRESTQSSSTNTNCFGRGTGNGNQGLMGTTHSPTQKHP